MLSPSEWTHEEVLDKLTSLPINSIKFLCFQKSTAGRPLRKEARALGEVSLAVLRWLRSCNETHGAIFSCTSVGHSVGSGWAL